MSERRCPRLGFAYVPIDPANGVAPDEPERCRESGHGSGAPSRIVRTSVVRCQPVSVEELLQSSGCLENLGRIRLIRKLIPGSFLDQRIYESGSNPDFVHPVGIQRDSVQWFFGELSLKNWA